LIFQCDKILNFEEHIFLFKCALYFRVKFSRDKSTANPNTD
ncbi:MAG: hypothetical protein ACI8RD_006136, partial [Bacillariaceae sp.]